MPRKTKAARLLLRSRKGRPQVYVILDAGREVSTGTDQLAEAEKHLAAYLTTKAREEVIKIDEFAPKNADEVTCDDVLAAYIEEHVPNIASADTVAYRVPTLLGFWGSIKLSQINGQVCRRYWKLRGVKPATLRRELGILQAAINFCYAEGITTSAPKLVMPTVEKTEKRWATRTEMYWILRGARKLRSDARKQATRFIIAGRYTGSRKGVLLNTRLDVRSLSSGYIDADEGILYRGAIQQTETNKRKPTVRLPRQMKMFARLWRDNGARFLVEDAEGNRLADNKKSFKAAIRNAEELAAANGYDLDLTGFTPHSLRHTAITWAMQNGAELHHVCGFFGLTAEMVERVYGHHHPDHQQSAIAAMEGKR